MVKDTLKVVNKLGIHARPSSMIVELTTASQSNVTMIYQGTRVNAKSILNIMMLAVEPGNSIDVEIDGPDEQEVLGRLKELFNSKFNEDGD